MTSVKSGGLPRRNKIYLERFHYPLRDLPADLVQVLVPRGSPTDTEGTPSRLPKGDCLLRQIPSLAIHTARLVAGTNAQNSHRRHAVVSIDTRRTSHGVSWYPRATTATRRSHGSEKAKTMPNFNVHLYFLFSSFPCLLLTVLYQLQHNCWDVPEILALVDDQIRRRLIQGLVSAVGVVSVLLWYPLVIESESHPELHSVIAVVNLKAVVISYLHVALQMNSFFRWKGMSPRHFLPAFPPAQYKANSFEGIWRWMFEEGIITHNMDFWKPTGSFVPMAFAGKSLIWWRLLRWLKLKIWVHSWAIKDASLPGTMMEGGC